MWWRRPKRIEAQDALAAGAAAREVGLEHVVAFEPEALDLVEEQLQHRDEVLGLEQVDVERVLEVGGRVRRDHERGAVGPQDARELGHVQHRVHEVLDDVRRHDRSRRAVADRRARRRRMPANSQARDRACGRAAGLDDGRRAVVDADDEAIGRARAARSARPTPQPTSSTTPGPRRAATSR